MRRAFAWVLAVPLLRLGTAVPVLGPGYWLAMGVLDGIQHIVHRFQAKGAP